MTIHSGLYRMESNHYRTRFNRAPAYQLAYDTMKVVLGEGIEPPTFLDVGQMPYR